MTTQLAIRYHVLVGDDLVYSDAMKVDTSLLLEQVYGRAYACWASTGPAGAPGAKHQYQLTSIKLLTKGCVPSLVMLFCRENLSSFQYDLQGRYSHKGDKQVPGATGRLSDGQLERLDRPAG